MDKVQKLSNPEIPKFGMKVDKSLRLTPRYSFAVFVKVFGDRNWESQV
jgi:hypothetical protein